MRSEFLKEEIAADAGARAFEAPANYEPDTPWYYAALFEDIGANKLEICYRE